MKNIKAVILIFCFGTVCCAQQTSSSELINNAKQYDGQNITYTGEVIGDVMLRGDFAWVNVNDGQNAMGIWLNQKSAEKIKITGSYSHIGDHIMVTGVFHRNCIEHGGDMDIHAQDIQIISTGRTLSENFDTAKRNVVFILLAIISLAVIFLRQPKNVSS
jgi:hypothetical protein